MRRYPVVLTVLLLTSSAGAYVRSTTQPGGRALFRNDIANIQWELNDQAVPGMTGASGVIITASSFPQLAVSNAINTWNGFGATTMHLANLIATNQDINPNGNHHIIIFTDTPEHRNLVGSALAVTVRVFTAATGEIFDSDMIFNPALTFSTTLEANTYDIQSVLTHEIGHSIGMGHTNFLGAAMYKITPPSSNFQRRTSSDEAAFARAVYPHAGITPGSIRGTVQLDGNPVRGAFVTAHNFDTFQHASALTSVNDGSYSIDGLVPGPYGLYVEPLDGPVIPSDVDLPDNLVDVNFRPTVHGGLGNPTVVNVALGAVTSVDLTVQPGPPTFDIEDAGWGLVGQDGGGSAGFNPFVFDYGSAMDILLWGPGFDDTISQDNIVLTAGGAVIRQGSVHLDPLFTQNGRVPVRFTVDIELNAPAGIGSILVAKGDEVAVLSGAIHVRPGPPAGSPVSTTALVQNSANGLPMSLAPESFVDLYGDNLVTQFLLNDTYPTELGGLTINVVDSAGVSRPAGIRLTVPDAFGTLDRIQFLMPASDAYGSTTLRLNNANGQSQVGIQLAAVGPGLFAANEGGVGPAAAVFQRFNNVPAQIDAGITFTPVAPGFRENVPLQFGAATDGLYVSFYGTGFRRTENATCRVGGVDIPVLGTVPQGQFPGLDQAVCGPVPRSLAGAQNVNAELIFDGITANVVTLSFAAQ